MESIDESFVMESPGIGLENESSLHSSIKLWYARPGDRIEVKVENSIVDILRGNTVIEIQTANFTAIRKKLYKLIKNHPVRLVFPVPAEKYILHTSPGDGHVIMRRKSPKKGTVYDIFNELIRVPAIINEDNFSLEVLLIKEEDIMRDDGKGSWRKRGSSTVDKKLTGIVKSFIFNSPQDFLNLIPSELDMPFTNKSLAKCVRIRNANAQKMTYCLRKMGIISETGKCGNQLLFNISKI